MVYAVKQDMIDRFGELELIDLTDRGALQSGVIDDTVLNGALADADATIDSYIALRYDLPLASTPAVLVKTAADLTRYTLHKDAPTDAVTEAQKAALRFLRDLSGGKAQLDVAGSEPARAGDTVSTSAPERIFSRDTLSGY